nr:uncharacterized protein LOC108388027 isoform X1 [Manis javanica]
MGAWIGGWMRGSTDWMAALDNTSYSSLKHQRERNMKGPVHTKRLLSRRQELAPEAWKSMVEPGKIAPSHRIQGVRPEPGGTALAMAAGRGVPVISPLQRRAQLSCRGACQLGFLSSLKICCSLLTCDERWRSRAERKLAWSPESGGSSCVTFTVESSRCINFHTLKLTGTPPSLPSEDIQNLALTTSTGYDPLPRHHHFLPGCM